MLSYICSIYACLVLSVSTWCLERAVACDCGSPWTFLLSFLLINLKLLTSVNSFLLNLTEHENISANKYDNANY